MNNLFQNEKTRKKRKNEQVRHWSLWMRCRIHASGDIDIADDLWQEER